MLNVLLLALAPVGLVLTLVVVLLLVFFWRGEHRRARRAGYPSTRAYLRAVPRDDSEKKDAVDLASTGLVICLLGLLFPPVLLVGLLPLFYGGRKLAYSLMGLGLVSDGTDASGHRSYGA